MTFSRRHRFLVLILPSLLIIVPSILALKCYWCDEYWCFSDADIPMIECAKGIGWCVTYVEERVGSVDHPYIIVRDCFKEKFQEICTPDLFANQSCIICNDRDGCNRENRHVEPLICNSCPFEFAEEGGLSCDQRVICMPPMRSISPVCHITNTENVYGNGFGCFHDMPRKARRAHLSYDLSRVHHMTCDSNNCNLGMEVLYVNTKTIQDTERFCYFGSQDYYSRGHCDLDYFTSWCTRTIEFNETLDFDINQMPYDCLRSKNELFAFERQMVGKVLYCNWDFCNSYEAKQRFSCHGPNNTVVYVVQPTDSCVTFNHPLLGYSPMGRSTLGICRDPKRCLLCKSDMCNSRVNMRRLHCYHTTGKEGWFIRKHQLDFMDMCSEEHKYCITIIDRDKQTVTRGCGTGKEPKALKCSMNNCNRQIVSNVCFSCRVADPNCVFSQGRESEFEECPFDHPFCYTRIYGDGSVERGCAREKYADSVYFKVEFCNDKILCNGLTTKQFSCHIFHGYINKPPAVPEFLEKPWATKDGFMFESCRDEDGLPACFTRQLTDNQEEAVHHSGCTTDISLGNLHLHDRRTRTSYFDFSAVLCDGHYCNRMPFDTRTWIPMPEDDEED